MEIKIKKKFIDEEIKVYIAEDRTEFETEKACEDYEDKILYPINIKQVGKLKIKDLDEVIPLSDSGLVDDISLAEKRQILNRVVCYNHANYQERWKLLYREFENKYHIDLQHRFDKYNRENKPKCKNK